MIPNNVPDSNVNDLFVVILMILFSTLGLHWVMNCLAFQH